MKKKFIVLGAIAVLLGLVGCQSSNDANVPSMLDTPATPTVTVAPTREVWEPTKAVVEPTQEVVELTNRVKEPTQEVESTVVPTEEPEVTEEHEVTPAFSLTVVPTPTEVPVVTEEPETTPTEKPELTATATPKPIVPVAEKPKATATPKPTSKPKATATPKPTATPKLAKVPHETHKHEYKMFANKIFAGAKTKVYDIPSDYGKLICELTYGTEVQAQECCYSGNHFWMKVKVDGKTGWVSEWDLSYKSKNPQPTASPKEAYLKWSSRKEERQRTKEANCYIDKSAENYGLVFEELGLPKDFSEYVYYSYDYNEKGTVEQNIRVYIPETMSDYECNSIDKIVYASADNIIAAKEYEYGVRMLETIEKLYESVMYQEWYNDIEFDTAFEKGQELHAVAFYPFWNVYKVEVNEAGTQNPTEFYVFSGQVTEKRTEKDRVHPYLNVELVKGEWTVTGMADYVNEELREVVIPNEIDGYPVTKIADYAFERAIDDGISVKFPAGLKEIGKYAFAECEIGSLTIPKCITVISEGCFMETTFEDFKWHDNITRIEDYAFKKCAGIADIQDGYKGRDDVTTYVRLASEARLKGTLKLPKELTYIGKQGLYVTVRNIEFNSKLKYLGFMALDFSGGYGPVILPEGLEEIDGGFAMWDSIKGDRRVIDGLGARTTIWIPDSVTKINIQNIADDRFAICTPKGSCAAEYFSGYEENHPLYCFDDCPDVLPEHAFTYRDLARIKMRNLMDDMLARYDWELSDVEKTILVYDWVLSNVNYPWTFKGDWGREIVGTTIFYARVKDGEVVEKIEDYEEIKDKRHTQELRKDIDEELYIGLSPYDMECAILVGEGVCGARAELVTYMMNYAGVDSHSDTNIEADWYGGLPHAWNMVRIDGVYYNVDATQGRLLRSDDYMYNNGHRAYMEGGYNPNDKSALGWDYAPEDYDRDELKKVKERLGL